MGIQGFGRLESLILELETKVGYFLIACINTHSLAFTEHGYLRPLGNEAKKALDFRGYVLQWEFKV